MKPIVVCSKRDGTINKHKEYCLEISPDWKEQLEFLPGVFEGIRQINAIPNSRFYILTSQFSFASAHIPENQDFSNFTEDRMPELNRHIDKKLAERGAVVTGFFSHPYDGSKHRTKQGNIRRAIASLDSQIREYDLWMIGDRLSDIELGLNSGGKSILVPSPKTGIERKKARIMNEISQGRVFLEEDFEKAARRVYGSYIFNI